MKTQRAIYCGKLHRRRDGVPIDHACRILHPAYLQAVRSEEYGRAMEILERSPVVLHGGIRRSVG